MAPANLTFRIRVEKAEGNDGDNGQSVEIWHYSALSLVYSQNFQ